MHTAHGAMLLTKLPPPMDCLCSYLVTVTTQTTENRPSRIERLERIERMEQSTAYLLQGPSTTGNKPPRIERIERIEQTVGKLPKLKKHGSESFDRYSWRELALISFSVSGVRKSSERLS